MNRSVLMYVRKLGDSDREQVDETFSSYRKLCFVRKCWKVMCTLTGVFFNLYILVIIRRDNICACHMVATCVFEIHI